MANRHFDFGAYSLTADGGLLPAVTTLKKLGFEQLIEQTLTIRRRTRSTPSFRFILGMILACCVGFSPESVSLSQARSGADRHP